MRNLNIILLASLAVPLTMANACLGDGIFGSDADFTYVDNRSNVTLVLVSDSNWTHGNDTDWNIQCESSAIDIVVVVVEDDVLLVTSTASALGDDCELSLRSDSIKGITIPGDGPIDGQGPCTELTFIDVTGNGNVSLDTVETDVLTITITGNGTLDIADVQANELVLHLTGNGDSTLAGNVDAGDFTIGGAGSLDASELVIGDLDIHLSGSGDATVNVTDSISGEVSGNGNLLCLGEPTDQAVTVTGSATGTITFL